jgi:hypothetical protein
MSDAPYRADWLPLLPTIPLVLLPASWLDALLIFGAFVLQAAIVAGACAAAKHLLDTLPANLIALLALAAITAWIDLLLQTFLWQAHTALRAHLPLAALCALGFCALQTCVQASRLTAFKQILAIGSVLASVELIRALFGGHALIAPCALLLGAGVLLAAGNGLRSKRERGQPQAPATSTATRRVRVTGPVS